jgi:predicted nucleic acid-binding protein
LSLVVDTSVAVKWYVAEDEHEKAKHLLLAGIELLAPDLLWAETANVLRRKVRMGEMSQEQAVEGVRSLAISIHQFLPSGDLVEPALDLSVQLNHSVYDCMYLAAALASDGRNLVTEDAKFAVKASAAGHGDRILSLDAAYARLTTGQENGNG